MNAVNYTIQFITGSNRHQTFFSTLEDQVTADNLMQLIDAFVDKLDLQKMGFIQTFHKSEGRPSFAPAVLFRLYGYLNKIRSSRKIEKESACLNDVRSVGLQ
jgi:transposase